MIKITCLIENIVYKGGLLGEHGLSFHIDTGTHSVLFDTGQTGNFAQNATRLGIDIAKIDAVVLSHGHYDHSGGLATFLELNKTAKIYLKKEALSAKYNGMKPIGFLYENLNFESRFIFLKGKCEIVPNVFAICSIPIINNDDTHWKHFFTEKAGQKIPDCFNDELFLAITNNNKLSVLSSCSHRGITNIIRAAKHNIDLPIQLVAGGFHLKDSHPDSLKPIVKDFKILKPEKIGVCHCTGLEHYELLKKEFPEECFYFHTGISIEL
jgi:7,8-dihydropterin-6-yl-methyl-4-(beta-D-ribofuranosyl)aminobenzene 5'-phosphate synthase